jgi:hypothetical protein
LVVRAPVAENDERGAPIDGVAKSVDERSQRAPVVRVAGDRDDRAAVRGSDRRASSLATKQRGRLADVADEDEAPRRLEQIVCRIHEFEQ